MAYEDMKEILEVGFPAYFAAFFAYIYQKYGEDTLVQLMDRWHHGNTNKPKGYREQLIELAEQLEDTNLPAVANIVREYSKKLPTMFSPSSYCEYDPVNGPRRLKQDKEKWESQRSSRRSK
jgi:hypothetical protein